MDALLGLDSAGTDSGAGDDSGFPVPGVDPGAVAALLAGFDPAGLDGVRCLDVLTGAQRLIDAAHALQAKAMHELTRVRPEPVREFVADEVALELSLTRVSSLNRVVHSVEMVTRIPVVLDAMAAGTLDLHRAEIIASATLRLDDAEAAAVAESAVESADGMNPGRLQRAVRRAVLRLDPDGAQRRHEIARRSRKVALYQGEDGMAELTAFLPAAEATSVYRRIAALARGSRIRGDQRSSDEKRADVLVNLLLGRRDPGTSARPDAGLRPLVQVTVSAATLAGLDDQPGELAGYGPIPAAMARWLAGDRSAKWRGLTTGPDGTVTGVSPAYRPPAALSQFVRARDGVCRFPGCEHPARYTDLDHVTPWPTGPTRARNLVALCRTHHRAKHQAGWDVRLDHHGLLHWHSPAGRKYTTRPAQHGPP